MGTERRPEDGPKHMGASLPGLQGDRLVWCGLGVIASLYLGRGSHSGNSKGLLLVCVGLVSHMCTFAGKVRTVLSDGSVFSVRACEDWLIDDRHLLYFCVLFLPVFLFVQFFLFFFRVLFFARCKGFFFFRLTEPFIVEDTIPFLFCLFYSCPPSRWRRHLWVPHVI